MNTNMYTLRNRRRKTLYRHNRRSHISAAQQRHRMAKLENEGVVQSHIAHQLGISRKTVRKFLPMDRAIAHALPKSLERAFARVVPQLPDEALYIVSERPGLHQGESNVSSAGKLSKLAAA